ncbi:MAG: S8 family serine peptidase [Pseudolabrys sp.]
MTQAVARLLLVIIASISALVVGVPRAHAQIFVPPPNNPVPTATTSAGGASSQALTPLATYGVLGLACTVGSTMVQAALMPRELTSAEVTRNGMTCFLGPAGWLLAGALFPELNAPSSPQPRPPRGTQGGGRGGFTAPPAGAFGFVPNEVLLRVRAGTSDAYLQRMARRLNLTRLETQTFTLTGQSVQRWRIDGGRSVAGVIQSLARYVRVIAAQSNNFFRLQQGTAPAQSGSAQYVVDKLHLLEAHRITGGDDVPVAVIDSQIDESHPELAGTVVKRLDLTGAPAAAHAHGTGMAGAVAAKGRLTGVAPRARLLAVRAFGGGAASTDATTFNVIKGIDWAASEGARVINMSFAGPRDPLMAEILAAADARGVVLVAAVGNAGPRSPPLFPGAYRQVIGVTATDSHDKLLPVANRGAQVAVAAPGVDVLLPAPGGGLQVTSGTSAAAAHVSGVAALLLARNPQLRPADVRRLLTTTATTLGPRPRNSEFGAGLVDALKAVDAAAPR